MYGSAATFFNLYTFGRTPWNEDQPVARQLPTHIIRPVMAVVPRNSVSPH
jgi:hypothetical protein